MKHFAIFILICLFVQPAIAQKFESFKFKIKLSKGWYSDGFGGDAPWEDGGSSVCHCSGVIIVNDYNEKNLRVAIYPSTKAGLDSLKRQQIWDYEFVPVATSESYITPYFTFTKKTSFLKDVKESGTGEITPYEVWRYEGNANDTYYLIYVFAENNEHPQLEPHRKEIEKLINTIQPLK